MLLNLYKQSKSCLIVPMKSGKTIRNTITNLQCPLELHELITPSPFFHRTNRRTAGFHPHLTDIPFIRTKHFKSSFLMRTAKEWNSLPASVFPSKYLYLHNYNPNVLKRETLLFFLYFRIIKFTYTAKF